MHRSMVASETESLAMSQFDFDIIKTSAKRLNFEPEASGGPPPAAAGGAPNPFAHEAQHHELFGMFARQQFAPRPVSALYGFIGLCVGLGLGALLTESDASRDVVSWVRYPGQAYFDALVGLVLPTVFCSMVVSVTDAVTNGNVRRLAVFTALWFVGSALLAAAVGTIFAAMFSSVFVTKPAREIPNAIPQLAFQCDSGNWLAMGPNGTVACSSANSSVNTVFGLQDPNFFFARSASKAPTFSLTDQLVGILTNMIPNNMLAGFVDGIYVAVVFTSFFFAVACSYGHDSRHGVPNYIVLMASQGQIVFGMIINELLKVMPVAVAFLLGGAIGLNKTSFSCLTDINYMMLALVLACLFYVFVCLGSALYITTRLNILQYLRHVLPAQVFSFGCSSTMATLPMTIRCVDTRGEVPPSVSRIVLPFAATCNLTGMSLFVPLAIVFLARITGNDSELTAGKYLELWILSAITAFGARLVDGAEIVMIATIWRVVVNKDVGEAITILVVTDWLLKRVRTLVSVTTHAVLVRIIAEQCEKRSLAKGPRDFMIEAEFSTPTTIRSNRF